MTTIEPSGFTRLATPAEPATCPIHPDAELHTTWEPYTFQHGHPDTGKGCDEFTCPTPITTGGDGSLSCDAGCTTADIIAWCEVQAQAAEEWLTAWEAAQGTARTAAPAEGDKGGADKRMGAVEVVRWVEENYTLGRSTDGMLYAVPRTPGVARVAREVKSLRPDITKRLYRERGIAVGPDTVSTALGIVEGIAADTDPTNVALRAVQKPGSVVLDLGDKEGRTVVVTAAGWRTEAPSDALPVFRRGAPGPLPVPTRGGSMDDLRELLDLDADDPRWLNIRGWLTAALFESVPRPILWHTGAQGSGKSTRARMVLSVLEPCDALGHEPGKNHRDDSTAARGRLIPSWDNISRVSSETSDFVCRLVTGVSEDSRKLYTDDELRVSTYRRTAVATSITLPHGLKADALERVIVIPLDRVAEADRKAERELWARFTEKAPGILGALLDDVAGVLANLDAVTAEKRDRPRMADYADILSALDRHLGIADDAGHFAAYVETVRGAMRDAALDDPFASAVYRLTVARGGAWSGSAKLLLTDVNIHAEHDAGRPQWWPTDAIRLSTLLTRQAETLRAAGVTIDKRRSKAGVTITLTLTQSHTSGVDDGVDEGVDGLPAGVDGRGGSIFLA